MPCYSLPLAVLIGSEPDHFGLPGVFLQFGHKRLLVIRYLILRFEPFVLVKGEIFLPQVADMAVARHHREVGAEKFSDSLRLVGRLYYDEVLNHGVSFEYGLDNRGQNYRNFAYLTKTLQ